MKKFVLKLPPKRQRLIYYQLYLVFFMFWMRDILHFPSAITYITDIITIIICISRFETVKRTLKISENKTQLAIIWLIMFSMLFGALIHFTNPALVLWAMRNDLRFFVFFILCISLLDELDISRIMHFFMNMFWINVVLCSVQYFLWGIKNDYLGGFFGVTKGCNTYINILICIVCAYAIVRFMNRNMSPVIFILIILSSVYLATLCELKVVYVEIVIIYCIAIISNKPSIKTIVTVILGIVLGVIIVRIASIYAPRLIKIFFDREAQLIYLAGNGYTNTGDLNRFTAIKQIHELFFKHNFLDSLFGFGIGNCEYSSFEFLQSDFAKKYSYLHYRWFSHAWIYLEQGAVGICLYILFFLNIGKKCISSKNVGNKEWIQFALLFVPICLLSMMYNCAIQTEAAYIVAFVCSIPFVVCEREKNRGILNDK